MPKKIEYKTCPHCGHQYISVFIHLDACPQRDKFLAGIIERTYQQAGSKLVRKKNRDDMANTIICSECWRF